MNFEGRFTLVLSAALQAWPLPLCDLHPGFLAPWAKLRPHLEQHKARDHVTVHSRWQVWGRPWPTHSAGGPQTPAVLLTLIKPESSGHRVGKVLDIYIRLYWHKAPRIHE